MSNDSITINSDAFTPLTSESSDGTKQKEFREKDALRKRNERYNWSSDKREEVNLSRRRRGQAQREALTETERKQLNDRRREREKMKLQLMSEHDRQSKIDLRKARRRERAPRENERRRQRRKEQGKVGSAKDVHNTNSVLR
jgi:hypothetical protein